MSQKTLTIIDTFGFFFRLYYAMSGLKNREGKPSGMVSGFASFIMNLRQEFASDYIIFALDSKGKTLRHEILGEYKANRSEPPAALKEQLPVCIEMIEKMGLAAVSREGYEADDIIASVVKECKQRGIFVRIVTHDKDLYQLIEDGKVSIYSPKARSTTIARAASKSMESDRAAYAIFSRSRAIARIISPASKASARSARKSY